MPCLWFPDTVLQYWSGNYWDNLKDIILPFPFQAFFFEQISAFPRKEKRVGTVHERKRDDGVTNRRYKPGSPDWWSLLLGMWGFSRFSFESFFTSRNVGFFPFQFRIVLTVLPFFKERLLAISLSASLKLSFWGSSPREFCHYIKIWPSVWINRLAKVIMTWYDLFRLFLQRLKTIYT